MNYVYILKSQRDAKLYIGCTKDLEKRLEEHNLGKVGSTKNRRPFTLIFYEAFSNKADAFSREQWFKTGFGYNHIRKMLTKTLESFEGSTPQTFHDNFIKNKVSTESFEG